MNRRPMSKVKAQITKIVHFSEQDEIGIENDPAFLRRIKKARAHMRAGKGVRLEDVPD